MNLTQLVGRASESFESEKNSALFLGGQIKTNSKAADRYANLGGIGRNSNRGSCSLDSEGYIKRGGEMSISRKLLAHIVDKVDRRNTHEVACLNSLRNKALLDLKGVKLQN